MTKMVGRRMIRRVKMTRKDQEMVKKSTREKMTEIVRTKDREMVEMAGMVETAVNPENLVIREMTRGARTVTGHLLNA